MVHELAREPRCLEGDRLGLGGGRVLAGAAEGLEEKDEVVGAREGRARLAAPREVALDPERDGAGVREVEGEVEVSHRRTI